MLRAALILVLALGLAGCGDWVQSKGPLFRQADRKGVPPAEPGLWAMIAPGCEVDVDQPVAKWPD